MRVVLKEKEKKMAGKFYAVKAGKTPGIYRTWEECKKETAGVSGAIYKSFQTVEEAAVFMGWTGTATEEEECELVAYVDGSFNLATGEYGSGVVVIEDGEEVELYTKGNDAEMASMRNVAGEILASELAMEYAKKKGARSLEIVHDYEGIARWCTGEWKANKSGTQRYRRVYEEYKKSIRIKFTKVKGHSGDAYNDMADALAKKAAGIL